MSNFASLRPLRSVLAKLYSTTDDARRVVQDAGLDPTYITFSEKAVNNWNNILVEADKHAKIKELLQEALSEYPNDPALKAVVQSYGRETGVQIDKPTSAHYSVTSSTR